MDTFIPFVGATVLLHGPEKNDVVVGIVSRVHDDKTADVHVLVPVERKPCELAPKVPFERISQVQGPVHTTTAPVPERGPQPLATPKPRQRAAQTF